MWVDFSLLWPTCLWSRLLGQTLDAMTMANPYRPAFISSLPQLLTIGDRAVSLWSVSRNPHQDRLSNGSWQVQVVQISGHVHPPQCLCDRGPALLTQKRIQGFWNCCAPPVWSTRPEYGCRARSAPVQARRSLFWKLTRDGNSEALGVSCAITTDPKPSPVRASWRGGVFLCCF